MAIKTDNFLLCSNNSITNSTLHTVVKDANLHEGFELPFQIEQVDGLFFLVLLCFVLFTHIYKGGWGLLKENLRALFTFKRIERLPGLSFFKDSVFSYLLVIQSVILLSIFSYDVLMISEPLPKDTRTPFLTILLFICLFAFYILFKGLIYRLIGFIFDEIKLMKSLAKTSSVVLELVGIICFFPVTFLVYSNFINLFFLICVLTVVALAQLALFNRVVLYFISQKFNFLYLIAYLCTVEIIPCVFFIMGLVYLYRFDVHNVLWLIK